MIKTKGISPPFIFKYQREGLFLYWPLMRFPTGIHLKHFGLMNNICSPEVSFVSGLHARYNSCPSLGKIHGASFSVSRGQPLESKPFSPTCPVQRQSFDNSAYFKESLWPFRSLSITAQNQRMNSAEVRRGASDSRRQKFTKHCAYEERINDMKIYTVKIITLLTYLCTNISLNPIYIYAEGIKLFQVLVSEHGQGSLKPR